MSTLLLIILHCFSLSIPLDDLRKKYHASGNERAAAEQLLKVTETITEKDQAIYRGYKGAAMMMWSQYEFNPFSKLRQFNAGIPWLEAAIKDAPQSLELRYLRFTFQCSVPSILGYYDHLEEDKQFILGNGNSTIDNALKKYIRDFLLQCDEISDAQKAAIKKDWV